MAIFSSKTKPCYDYDPNLKVKKELGKLKMELKKCSDGTRKYKV